MDLREVKKMVRKAPRITKEGVLKLLRNPRTPAQLKKYWIKVAKRRGWM